MATLQTTIRTSLQQRLEGAARIAVLGVGSDLRADDAAGLLVAQRIQEAGGQRTDDRRQTTEDRAVLRPPSSVVRLEVFLGGTAPENLTGEIKRFSPTHLVIIDAADLNAEPGAITLMDPDGIGGTTFCTHSLPLKVMIDYLLDSFQCHVAIVGIQPKSLEVGAPVSQEVRDAVESLAAMFLDALPQ
jgi:hydrogenase 3 maturation protease